MCYYANWPRELAKEAECCKQSSVRDRKVEDEAQGRDDPVSNEFFEGQPLGMK